MNKKGSLKTSRTARWDVLIAGLLATGLASAYGPAAESSKANAAMPDTAVAHATPVISAALEGSAPAPTSRISDHHVVPATRHRSYETGDLHILYSDKAEVVLNRLPRDAAGDAWQVGFREVKVAHDDRTIGWVETYNYSDKWPVAAAFGVGLYSSGSTVLHIGGAQAPGMVWFWEFMEGGKQAVVVWGPGHGGYPDDYELYDTRTGKLLGHAYTGNRSGVFASDTPAWATQAQRDCRRCTDRRGRKKEPRDEAHTEK